MKNKAIIRQDMIKHLSDFQKFEWEEKQRQTTLIVEKLRASENYQSAKSIALYMPTPIEFDLSGLFKEEDKHLLIPKTLPKRKMIFVTYDKENLERTKFGLLEPKSGKEEVPELIIVPGLAWNSQNYRVGFGGGYYDRYLAEFKGNTVSLIYSFQQLEFEEELHDIRIDEVLSV